MFAGLRRMPALEVLLAFAVPLVFTSVPARGFTVESAMELQQMLFGCSVEEGWLGGDHVASFHLQGGRYVWLFGDSFTNRTAKGVKPEGDALAQCNYFPSRNCAMPTNTMATWDNSSSSRSRSLKFHVRFDNRTGRPTSMLWPPDWAGLGRTPKVPTCRSCSLWAPPSVLHRSPEQCARGLAMDKGGCCSTVGKGCAGYCCHDELYFSTMAGIANQKGDKAFLLARMGKASKVMPQHGDTFGTYGVSIGNVRKAPEDWTYESARMPGTHVWPWSHWNETMQFFSAISRAYATEKNDLVYLLGNIGRSRVLARADLNELLDLKWEAVEFWTEDLVWQPYRHSALAKNPEKAKGGPKLARLWEFDSPEASLHFDKRIDKWLVPEVRARERDIIFRMASAITGPYQRLVVGSVPADIVQSDLEDWDVRSVKNHPELASEQCLWVLSMVFHWKSEVSPPPLPGLFNFPRLLCVTGSLDELDKNFTSEPPSDGCALEDVTNALGNRACGLNSGCHSCQARAEFLAREEGQTLAAAYRIIAAQFREQCGVMARCAQKAAEAASFLQAWDAALPGADSRAARWRWRLGAGLLALPGLLAMALPVSLGLTVLRRHRHGLQRLLSEDPLGPAAAPLGDDSASSCDSAA